MVSHGRVTIREVGKTNVLQKMETIRGDISASRAILMVLDWFIKYDPNYLRVNILKLQPLSEQEIQLLKDQIQESIQIPTPSTTTV